jgi:hypothetical protein
MWCLSSDQGVRRNLLSSDLCLQELGVLEAAAALASSKPEPKRQKKVKAAPSADSGERRVSSRERKVVNYCELETRTAREPRAPVDHSERIKVCSTCCKQSHS